MTTVRQALQAELDENGGLITFEDFMRIALHHPQDGYYARNVRGIGLTGDFTTVPQRRPGLGEFIARWLREESSRRQWRKYHIIECGPGSGTLAAQVMQNFGWWERRRLTLHLVESSAPLTELQRNLLRHFRVHWHNSVEAALTASQGRALIYHNEFFDAFPCRVFQKQSGRWLELHLRVHDGRLTESWISRPLPDSTVFHQSWPEGQRVEVFASVHYWLNNLDAHWKQGAMLAIDYGGSSETIYHRRPAGTLRAYRQQQRLAGPSIYEIPGHQDLTADVNFDDLTHWARTPSWSVCPFAPLSQFAPNLPGAEAFQVVSFSK